MARIGIQYFPNDNDKTPRVNSDIPLAELEGMPEYIAFRDSFYKLSDRLANGEDTSITKDLVCAATMFDVGGIQ